MQISNITKQWGWNDIKISRYEIAIWSPQNNIYSDYLKKRKMKIWNHSFGKNMLTKTRLTTNLVKSCHYLPLNILKNLHILPGRTFASHHQVTTIILRQFCNHDIDNIITSQQNKLYYLNILALQYYSICNNIIIIIIYYKENENFLKMKRKQKIIICIFKKNKKQTFLS